MSLMKNIRRLLISSFKKFCRLKVTKFFKNFVSFNRRSLTDKVAFAKWPEFSLFRCPIIWFFFHCHYKPINNLSNLFSGSKRFLRISPTSGVHSFMYSNNWTSIQRKFRSFSESYLCFEWSSYSAVLLMWCLMVRKKTWLILNFRYIWGCAGQLPITSATLLPSDEKFWSISRTHSSNSTLFIQLFIDPDISKVKLNVLKLLWFWAFQITNISNHKDWSLKKLIAL